MTEANRQTARQVAVLNRSVNRLADIMAEMLDEAASSTSPNNARLIRLRGLVMLARVEE